MSKAKLAEAIKALSYDEMMDFANAILEGCAMNSFTLIGTDETVSEAEIAQSISQFASENRPVPGDK